jgi:ribonuclease HII
MRLFVRHRVERGKPPRIRCRGLPRVVEEQVRAEGYGLVAGVDEAGRGALAGPVVAAAIILPSEHRVPHVVDSKRLDGPQREHLRHELLAQAIACAVGIVPADRVDAINIRQASREAMCRAIAQLQPAPGFALVDGNDDLPLSVPQRSMVDGDARCYCIAAASIIAKVCRDRLMDYLGGLYPAYGFASNRGYGTPEHLQALRAHGPCFVHRRSFSPVRQQPLAMLLSSTEIT